VDPPGLPGVGEANVSTGDAYRLFFSLLVIRSFLLFALFLVCSRSLSSLCLLSVFSLSSLCLLSVCLGYTNTD
jgi:hypothetical protein